MAQQTKYRTQYFFMSRRIQPIGEEHEGLHPCIDRPRRRPLAECCRSHAHSDKARTSPTSYVWRAIFRTGRGAVPFREGARKVLLRPSLRVASTSIRGGEVASGVPPGAR